MGRERLATIATAMVTENASGTGSTAQIATWIGTAAGRMKVDGIGIGIGIEKEIEVEIKKEIRITIGKEIEKEIETNRLCAVILCKRHQSSLVVETV